MDGQFDECRINLKEIRAVQDSLTKTLIAVYHGRIKLPQPAKPPEPGSASAGSPTAEEPPRLEVEVADRQAVLRVGRRGV